MRRTPVSWTSRVALGLTLLTASLRCGPVDTAGRRITFDVHAHGVSAESTNEPGWHVVFTRAFLVVGPLRFVDGEPLFGTWRARAFSWGTAFAHPGHYEEGGLLGEITSRRVLDLVDPAGADLGPGDGVTGTVRSARVELHPGDDTLGPARSLVGAGTLVFAGRADRNGRTVHFTASLPVDQKIEGIPAAAEFRQSGGRWDLAVHLEALLRYADLSPLADGSAAAPTPIPADSVIANAVVRALTTTDTFRFTWNPRGRDE